MCRSYICARILDASKELDRKAQQRPEPKPGEKYLHFKGNTYEIVTVARYSENHGQRMVVYKDNQGQIWVRPYKMFMSAVNFRKYPQARQIFRFKLVEEPEAEERGNR